MRTYVKILVDVLNPFCGDDNLGKMYLTSHIYFKFFSLCFLKRININLGGGWSLLFYLWKKALSVRSFPELN